MRLTWFVILLVLPFSNSFSQSIELRGRVSDKEGRPLTFVSIWIDSACRGVLTNDEGFYRLNLKPGVYALSFRSPGYNPSCRTIRITDTPVIYNLNLSRCTQASEFTGDADSLLHMVILNRNARDASSYSGQLYTKELQRIIDAPDNFLKNVVGYRLEMNPDKKGIVNLSESLAEFQLTAKHHISQHVIAALTSRSSRSVFNFNKVPELHIDFYQNTVYLKNFDERGFISPLSNTVSGGYRYRLAYRFTDSGRTIDAIQVQPVKKDSRLFSGTIYVIEKEWKLYGVDLSLAWDANIDFIDSIKIKQQYVAAKRGDWLPQAMQFRFYGNFWGYKYSGSFTQVYKDAEQDVLNAHIFNDTVKNYQKDKKFWEETRAIPFTAEEESFYLHRNPDAYGHKINISTDSLQKNGTGFRFFPYLLLGYTYRDYSNNSFLRIQAPYDIFFYNTIEGWGADLKLKYTKIYNSRRSLTLISDTRYGFSNHVFNANLSFDYVYDSYRRSSVYGRFGTDFLDLNSTGTISPFLNSLTTLYFGNNYLKLYQSRFAMAGTSGEIISGLLLNGQVEYDDRSPLFNTRLHTFNKDSVLLTSNNPLDPYSNSPLFPHYCALILRASATFVFNKEVTITPDGKFLLPSQYPVIRVNAIAGIPAFQSVVNYSFLSVDVFQERLNIGSYGYTAFYLSGGGFLNVKKLYYPDYKQFHGGQSFFFDAQLGGFHFLNFYSYSTDRTYFELHAEHNFTGKFLEKVPWISRLGIQEIIGGSYLTQGSLPDYEEIYIGLKRTAVRLDYGLAFGRFTKMLQGFRFSYNIP